MKVQVLHNHPLACILFQWFFVIAEPSQKFDYTKYSITACLSIPVSQNDNSNTL